MVSSLKLCHEAEGGLHLYPKRGPTSEWNTTAAHKVVKAACGTLTIAENNRPLH